MEKSLIAFLLISLLGFGNGQQLYDANEILVDASKHDEQFFTFLSRPDIDAPRWDFKVYNESALAPGYWFVSPYGKVEQTDNDKPYVGPAIYDPKNGELVWNGAPRFQRYNTFSFKISKFNDKEWISLHHPQESHGVIMDEEYHIRRHIRTGIQGRHGNMHDFQVIENGKKALYLTTYVKKTSVENSLAVGFDGRCSVAFIGFEERKVDTEEVAFKWFPEDRIGLDESYLYDGTNTPQRECAHGNFDYLHLNSIEKLPDKDYLVSGRRTYTIYKISHIDGSIVWRLGGKKSDFTMEEDTHFTGQHDVRCLSQNSTHMLVSMMDNAVGPHWTDITNPNSRGLLLSVNTETMTARKVSTFDHPYGVGAYAPERGNFQTLPNGNAFLSWTKDALHSEHSPDGTVIAEAMFPSGLKTYRSYKFPWVGHPQAPPDVHSQVVTSSNGSVNTVVHVSWNGDTEVEQWNLYETDVDGTTSDLLASTKRTGFETSILYEGYAAFVRVDAIDRDGKKRTESKSHVARTIAMLGSDGTIPQLPASGSWNGMLNNPKDIVTNPILTFLGGILFCAAAMLTAKGVWRKCGRRTFSWRRKQQRLYAALNDSDEDRAWPEGDGLLSEKSNNREPLAEDDED